MKNNYTAILQKEDDMYVALCPELDVASQGLTVEEAKENLTEAIELFLENSSDEEKKRRFHPETYVTTISA
ncbi:MAG: type II toxin-antitoxin system HicB family antitoxin [Spirochaetia bacterium]|nr:type II toxin-antitoxin system HicB family antitoxin [Spirochaetia bacterium]